MSINFKTMDGNTAAAYVSYAFTEVAAIYPITPSSDMAEHVDQWSAQGKKNIFGQTVSVIEMQSEAGAAGALHGSLAAGALSSTYTASQGLLLMIPNMYKIAGELLPGVFHVSARALATHALSIFGDQSDIMAANQTGFAMLASGSVQEVMDLAGVAHLAAIKSRVPFVHFFDGFRTSHEIQKIEEISYDTLAGLVDRDALREFKDRALNPDHPVTRGSNQNPDVFFQGREASNKYYEKVPDIVNEYMQEISKITGRKYAPFVYYGDPNAEDIIISMGSSTSVIEETIDYLNKNGYKTGLLKIHLYRPFSAKYFFDALPASVKRIAVLDRSKDPVSLGEGLYKDIRSLFYDKEEQPVIIGGRYGLGSKDFNSDHVKAVFDNLALENPKDSFTVGIIDDVTMTSLDLGQPINTEPEGTKRCKFWGLGSDGTVGANKDAIKIIGDNTDLFAQGYFSYDSKKSGGVTVSHLRFGKEPIKSSYMISKADYVGVHNHSYLWKYDTLDDLVEGGVFVLNTTWSLEELEEKIPARAKRQLAEKNLQFYIINAAEIARKVGLGNRINMIMQTVFFKLADVLPLEESIGYLKDAIVASYGNKGEKVVEMNHNAVDQSIAHLIKVEIPEEWAQAQDADDQAGKDKPEFIRDIADKVNALQGDKLPVSAFVGREDGTMPPGTSAYEKRSIALYVPEWIADNCIQCTQCSFVCPHASIRPFLLNEEEKKNAPEGFNTIKAMGKQLEGLEYKIQVSTLDCTGCLSCVEVCPAPTKALQAKPIESQTDLQVPNWNYAIKEIEEEIKTIGLYRNKAKHLLATAAILSEKYQGQVPASREELMELPGVGRKTANVVVSNAFGQPAIAVDTHVFRVSRRLCLASASSVDGVEEDLMEIIAKEDWTDAHHWLIWHGRTLCKAQNPLCLECPLADECCYWQSSQQISD
jgi:pyruvate-ferredoxin/flavodoxin oxidoreductase